MGEKISALPAAGALAGTEEVPIVQSAATVKATVAAIANAATSVRTVATGGTGAATLTGYVYGNGTSAMTASTTIPYANLAGRAYASYFSSTNQTGSTVAGTAVQFASTFVAGAGISVANDGGGNPTRITMAAAGTYLLSITLQGANSGGSDYDLTSWLQLDGTNIVASSQIDTIPKVSDGGRAHVAFTFMLTVTAGQYVNVLWLPENAAVTLVATAAVVGPPAYPSQASAMIQVQRIA